ncbi:MAG: hypothetical protein NDI61_10330 [Bdellovibrionaceae bacterium]|nr:hypothetical protein [Pseudobdellovibrionaceae bacterium]
MEMSRIEKSALQPDTTIRQIEEELDSVRQLFFELNLEDLEIHADRILIEPAARERLEKLAHGSWSSRETVGDDCFVAVAEVWDESMEFDPEDDKWPETTKIEFRFVPSELMHQAGPMLLSANPRWKPSRRFRRDPDYKGLGKGDFLMRHLVDWRAGNPPPVDVYSFVIAIFGPK